MTTTESSGLCRLTSEVLLKLEGIDAKNFLQGQTTANFEAALSGDVLAGAFCDVKGRVLADFLAAIVSDALILLRLDKAVSEQLQNHLKPYLMFSKSTLTPTEDAVFGVIDMGSLAPTALNQFSHQGDVITVQLDPTHFELWFLGISSELPGETITPDHWRRASILRGDARVELDTVGKYLPQDLNYDLNGRVNFKKGCYTGQEIIARLHYRGTPKRRLVIAHYGGAYPMQAGTSLYTSERSQAVGSVVNVAMVNQQQWLLLECIENGLSLGLSAQGDDTLLAAL